MPTGFARMAPSKARFGRESPRLTMLHRELAILPAVSESGRTSPKNKCHFRSCLNQRDRATRNKRWELAPPAKPTKIDCRGCKCALPTSPPNTAMRALPNPTDALAPFLRRRSSSSSHRSLPPSPSLPHTAACSEIFCALGRTTVAHSRTMGHCLSVLGSAPRRLRQSTRPVGRCTSWSPPRACAAITAHIPRRARG